MVLDTRARRDSRGAVGLTGLPLRCPEGGRACRCAALPVWLLALSLIGGTGVPASAAPVVKVSEGGLHFGNQRLGTTSAARSVTVTNQGPGSLSLSGASIIGADAADFTITVGTGPALLAEHGFLTLNVLFSPKATGDRTAQLQFNDDGTGAPQIVALTGTGTPAETSTPPPTTDPLVSFSPSVTGPAVTLSASSLNFPLRPVGSTSPAMTLKLTNTGGSVLHIIDVTFGGPIQTDFHFTGGDNAGTLAPGASRDITLNFSPITAGLRTTRVDVITDAASNPDKVPVQGIGVATGGANLPAIASHPLLFASAIDGHATSSQPDQVFITAGQCVTLTLLLQFRGDGILDVTTDPNTTFFTDPARDGFSLLNHSNVFCTSAADAGKTFPIYARAYNQSDHQVLTDTLIVHVQRSGTRK
jgi:hypothetical protein